MVYLTTIKKKITLHSKLWFKRNKEIWQGMVMRIFYSDTECDVNDLKVNWLGNKIEDRVLIKIFLLNR